MQVRRARPDEIEVVVAVLVDAAVWLRARAVEQWPDRFPTEWVLPAIEAGETWLAELDGQIVGTLVLQWDRLGGAVRNPRAVEAEGDALG